jgi:hypothetical protein
LIFSISCCWHHTIAINSDKTLNPKGFLQFPNSLIQSINKVLPPPQKSINDKLFHLSFKDPTEDFFFLFSFLGFLAP